MLDGDRPFAELVTEAPLPDESGPGWSDDATRIGRLALRLWEPILDAAARRPTGATMVDAPPEFDPRVPVPPGVTVLEASAGTGKTHAVASILVAEVAAGRPIDEILVVTFTRKATGTLRERVWRRVGEAAAALAHPDEPTTDELIAHLRTGEPALVAERLANLQRALATFDTATIETIHGFCQQALASLGTAGDAERDLALVDDIDQLRSDAVDDLFVRRFHAGGDAPFGREAAARMARKVVDNPDAQIAGVDDLDDQRLRRRFALTLRDRVHEQKRRGRLLTFDDLLSRLDHSLDPARGTAALERLRSRYSMAVVDEFQDTDSVQWRIFERLFAEPPWRLVLVGDPKQAIYGFRGGDVVTYLNATGGASARLGLSTSWRSDGGLLAGLDALFDGAELGHPEITHRRLAEREGAAEPRLLGPPAAPFTVRIVDRSSSGLPTYQQALTKGPARALVAIDVAAEAVRLLQSGATICDRDRTGAVRPGTTEALAPRHLAVLVRTHTYADQVRAAMAAVGVPAVVHGGSNVLRSTAATDWLDLLRAIETPAFGARVRAAARGPFLAWSAARLAEATDDEWDELDETLRDWSGALREHGAVGLLRAVERSQGLTARVLANVGGERLLSDLRHVAELLHAELVARPGSAATLVSWLADRINRAAQAGTSEVDEDRRRLESDADAVTILTIHAAKGLEFPVVLLPSLWDGAWTADDEPPVFHDADGVRFVGVGSRGEVHQNQMALAAQEREQEELRLLYVALTRARHKVVVWWATGTDARRSAFARVLLGRTPGTGAIDRELARLPEEATIRDVLSSRSFLAGGAIGVEDATGVVGPTYVPPAPPTRPLAVAEFGRTFDRTWTRTSYSGLTAAAHDAASPVVVLEPAEVDETVKVDEPDGEQAVRPPAGDPLAVVVPLSDLPGGARVGTMVHEALEDIDFAAPDLSGRLAAAVVDHGADRLVPGQVDDLVAGLVAALATPSGRPSASGRSPPSNATTGSTSSPSTCPWAAASMKEGWSPWRRWPTSSPRTSRPTTRWRATTSDCAIRCWPPGSGAISPAASTWSPGSTAATW